MSSSRKRSREDDTDMLSIKTAEGEPLHADSFSLRAFSSCARQLPADTTEWDVSGFMHNGQPFSHDTVKCWLACISSTIHGAAELDEDDTAQLGTATGLRAVLSFAHAVGSPPSVFTAACSQLVSLEFVLQSELTVKLQMLRQGGYWWFEPDTRRVCVEVPRGYVSEGLTEKQEREFRLQVAEQCAALLHMAHVLKLQPLISALHSFVFWNSKLVPGVLYGALDLVFTDAVIDAAIGSGTISKEAYMSSVLSKPYSFASGAFAGQFSLFKPTSQITYDAETNKMEFEAALVRDFAGCEADEAVSVNLGLFDNLHDPDGCPGLVLRTSRGRHWFPVQLLLGSSLENIAHFSHPMNSALPPQL